MGVDRSDATENAMEHRCVAPGTAIDAERDAELLAEGLADVSVATLGSCISGGSTERKSTLSGEQLEKALALRRLLEEKIRQAAAGDVDAALGDGSWNEKGRVSLWGVDVASIHERLGDNEGTVILYKFLIAKEYHTDTALRELLRTVCWRISHGIDKLETLETADAEFREYCAFMDGCGAFLCTKDVVRKDSLGRPVFICKWSAFGKADVWELNCSDKENVNECYSWSSPREPPDPMSTAPVEFVEPFLKWWLLHVERVVASMDLDDFATSSMVVVHDLSDIRLSMLNKPARILLSKIIKSMISNYPDMSRRHIIINAPFFINILLGFVFSFLNERTRKKASFVLSCPVLSVQWATWFRIRLLHINFRFIPSTPTLTAAKGHMIIILTPAFSVHRSLLCSLSLCLRNT